MDAVAPLLNLTNSGSGSNAINKVVVAQLCEPYASYHSTILQYF